MARARKWSLTQSLTWSCPRARATRKPACLLPAGGARASPAPGPSFACCWAPSHFSLGYLKLFLQESLKCPQDKVQTAVPDLTPPLRAWP